MKKSLKRMESPDYILGRISWIIEQIEFSKSRSKKHCWIDICSELIFVLQKSNLTVKELEKVKNSLQDFRSQTTSSFLLDTCLSQNVIDTFVASSDNPVLAFFYENGDIESNRGLSLLKNTARINISNAARTEPVILCKIICIVASDPDKQLTNKLLLAVKEIMA
ncbi:hypothetical protein C0584_04925 [Candidatus Parcubacteria bacterium]|nr:MAG: hypothetical protein C0584_04925 [Candidatus Parcubacteria bacterium]